MARHVPCRAEPGGEGGRRSFGGHSGEVRRTWSGYGAERCNVSSNPAERPSRTMCRVYNSCT
eukprot:4489956-Lingulodinium_polyedra.AAC.1